MNFLDMRKISFPVILPRCALYFFQFVDSVPIDSLIIFFLGTVSGEAGEFSVASGMLRGRHHLPPAKKASNIIFRNSEYPVPQQPVKQRICQLKWGSSSPDSIYVIKIIQGD